MEGLSLIEVAIALAVSALLLGGLMVPLAAQIDRYRLRETEAALAQALEALLGYAASHGNRLPCPDIDGDGMEDLPGSVAAPCRGIEGELPRATLGIPAVDGWGRPLRYRGNDALTGPNGVPQPPNTRGGLRIDNPRTAERLTVGDPEAPAAILFSCGANGHPDGTNDGTGGSPAGCSNPSALIRAMPMRYRADPDSKDSTTSSCGCRRTCSSAGWCGRGPGHDRAGDRPDRRPIRGPRGPLLRLYHPPEAPRRCPAQEKFTCTQGMPQASPSSRSPSCSS